MGNLLDQLAGEHGFGRRCQRMRPFVVEQHQPVVVTTEAVLNQVAGNQRDVLPAPLGLCVLFEIAAFSGEPDAERSFLQGSDFGQDVRVFDQFDWRNTAGILLQLVLGGVVHAVISHRRHADEDIRVRCACHHGRMHVERAPHLDPHDALRDRQVYRS
ncbi:hypothetical protein SDC9_123689 [bioreactor metagenome]|uniref:Uncharacterized protein n=1 Tax=bioreactor metagenome TaxID=1076179 RepID=A0A645CIC7_9ZZZZ